MLLILVALFLIDNFGALLKNEVLLFFEFFPDKTRDLSFL